MNPLGTDSQRLYTPQFFLLFVAQLLYMSGQGMLFHFAQYVHRIGGTVDTVGWIVGIGMVGSLLIRPFAGRLVDRLGCKPLLLAASGSAAVAIFMFQWFDHVFMACLLRIVVQLALAAFLVTIAVLAAQISPPGRSAESLASIGIGGLAGMTIGPTVGDFIFTGHEQEAWAYHLFFTVAALLMAGSFVLLCFARSAKSKPSEAHALGQSPSFFRLTITYWPGAIVVMGFCFACMHAIPVSFVERLVEARGFANIKFFFLAYSPQPWRSRSWAYGI